MDLLVLMETPAVALVEMKWNKKDFRFDVPLNKRCSYKFIVNLVTNEWRCLILRRDE